MARVICTNEADKYREAVNRLAQNGLVNYTEIISEGITTVAFQKRVIKNENCLRLDNGDYVCTAGTLIYDSLLGRVALEKIYQDFDGDINKIRKRSIGNYFVLIKKGSYLYGFVDKYQTLRVYYYFINGHWFIANSLADLGFALNNPQIDEYAFVQEALQGQVLGKQSIFKDVYQLYGNEFIEINLERMQMELKPLTYSRKKRNLKNQPIENIVDEYVDLVVKHFTVVAKTFGSNIGIHMTGGLDNRTVFAAFMATGYKPDLLIYGVGNTVLTNTKIEDLNIVKKYAELFNLDLYIMNWEHQQADYDVNDNWDKYFKKYGFYYSIYGASSNLFREYEGKMPSYPMFMEYGYFGENLRLREWLKGYRQNSFGIKEFVYNYHINPMLKSNLFYPKNKEFSDYLVGLFEKYSLAYDILGDTAGKITRDNFDEYRWLTARYSDSKMLNFCNEFTYSIAMFSIEELHEFAFDIPAQYREDGRFQLMLIEKLYPKVLDIPIFSHCHHQKLDKEYYRLTPVLGIENKISRFLKKLGINKHGYELLKKAYYITQKSKDKDDETRSKHLKKLLIEQINQDSDGIAYINPESFYGDLRSLYNYAQYVHGIKIIQEYAKKEW